MTTRSKGPLAGFGWLSAGLGVGFRHPKPLLGGAAMLVLAVILPTLITMPMQFHSLQTGVPETPAFVGWVTLASMLLSLLVVPLYAGYLQVIDAAERGLPARAIDIFKPYRDGEAMRLIGYGLAAMVVYIALIGIVLLATGGGIIRWYMQALSAQASHQPPPGLPAGFGIVVVLFMVIGLVMMGFYAISLGQVALRRRSVFAAIGDGLLGALKNLLPLLVFMLIAIVAWVVFAIALVIVVLVFTLIAKLVGTWLMLVLLVPLYLAMILAMITVSFGVMYHLWRDVCGEDVVVATPPPFIA